MFHFRAYHISESTFIPKKTYSMKSIRILFACVLASFASVALVRAESGSKSEKKAVVKTEKIVCCCPDSCVKPEKTEKKTEKKAEKKEEKKY